MWFGAWSFVDQKKARMGRTAWTIERISEIDVRLDHCRVAVIDDGHETGIITPPLF
jgi:hypothetical protein